MIVKTHILIGCALLAGALPAGFALSQTAGQGGSAASSSAGSTPAQIGIQNAVVGSSEFGSASDNYPKPAKGEIELSAVAALGRDMFFDKSLSASGEAACATCHDPAFHYTPSDGRVVELGGPHLASPGRRATPSIAYARYAPSFSIGPFIPDADDMSRLSAIKQNNPDFVIPQGGQFWDGRANTLQQQALGPLTTPFEMDNTDSHDLFRKFKDGYGDRLSQLFGPSILEDEDMLINEAAFAIARFELEDNSFHRFDSKYDYYLRGEVDLSDQEKRGLALYNDPKGANCADCHPNTVAPDGAPPMFTDYQFEAVGLPRNMDIPENADPTYFDIGLCGPYRTDMTDKTEYCGFFRAPTLRNTAIRYEFFHNGIFDNLEDVLTFYVQRDIHPEKFYPKKSDGTVAIYNDLPSEYHGNVDHVDPPFDRKPGDEPALNDQQIQDLIAYLKTLTDGFDPKKESY